MRGKLAKGTAWISAAGAVTNFLSFISTIVLARFLVPADFGLVALATTILAILNSVTDLSLSSALVQHRNPTIDHFNTAWTLGFARSLILTSLFCAAAYPLGIITHDARLPAVMLVLGIGLILTGIANPRAIMVTRDLIFWQQFLLTVGQRLSTFVVAVMIAVIFRSYWAIVWGSVIGQAINVVISYTILPFRPGFGLKHTKELIHFSVWLTVSQIINTLNYNFDQLIIGTGIGRVALGYYSVGNNLAVMPTRETTRPITVTLFPAFSQLKDDIPRLGAAYQKAQSMVTAITLPAGFGMALIAAPMVRLFMGEKWLPVVFIIQVLAAVFAIQTIGTLSQPLAMATGATRLLFIRDLQGFLMRVPFIIAGMMIDGLTGIIYARAITGLIAVLLHMQVIKRITALTFSTQFAANIRSLTSVCVMTVVLYLASRPIERLGVSIADLVVEITALITLGGISYIGSHTIMWIIMGKPQDGPEHELIKVSKSIVQLIRPKITSIS